MIRIGTILLLSAGVLLCAPAAHAEENTEELAKKLANPVAALISVPFQLNYDQDIGPVENGERWTLNIQPVVPIELNKEWNVISRTILPVVWQDDIFPGAGSQSGIGDIVQSVFFSPKAPTAGGWIWGAGPVLLLPTGSDDLLTADKWGAGPTAVVLTQFGPWTYGGLFNHIWSFAGNGARADISNTFLQPFMTYTTPAALTLGLDMASTYDWKNEKWSVPINASVSKVTKIGGHLVSVGAGVRYWADSPASGPEGLGFRLVATLLLPK
ncbi:MAG: transporter [Deltaproteobacteria bacterium]|nr:MAG: transporter [Deltaproteobacteria bacterium]